MTYMTFTVKKAPFYVLCNFMLYIKQVFWEKVTATETAMTRLFFVLTMLCLKISIW